jgi:hypothetical protein
VILPPTLELLLAAESLLLVEEFGALERMLERRLVASDVSPDVKSFSNEPRALLSGLDLWDLLVWVELVEVK